MKVILKSVFFCAFTSLLFSACQKEVANTSNLTPPTVEAGTGQVVQAPVSSVTLTGSATTTNGNIVGYLWSLVYGPNVPVITRPGSPSTTVTSLIAGTYLFQLMAIDEAGLTGLDTVSVRVNPSAVQTLTLQPTNNPYDVHLGIVGNTNVTDNNSVEFSGGAWTNGGLPFFTRGLFKFDLSGIPAGSTILSAKLSLYSDPTPLNGNLVDANSGPANALYLERVTSIWNPATVTWQNQPSGDVPTQISIPHTSQPFLDLIDIDVKNMVTIMAGTANYGFLIRLQNEQAYNIRIFCSGRHPIAAKHPKLVITYQ